MMIQAFRKEVLNYLNIIGSTKGCAGLENMHRSHDTHLPNLRTLYRWHKDLGPLLDYFPNVEFRRFGLVHMHLMIPNASEEWLKLPFCLEALWLSTGRGDRTLYLHCLIPEIWEKRVVAYMERKETRAESPGLTYFFSGEGEQTVNHLHSCVDIHGRLHTPINEPCIVNLRIKEPSIATLEPITTILTNEPERLPGSQSIPESKKHSTLLTQYPFAVPIIFEHYGRRISMEKLWTTIQERLGKEVWNYLPRHTRRLSVNGKSYIRKGYKLLNEHGLFTQNFLRYKPLLSHGLEFILIIRTESQKQLQECVKKLVPYTPIVEVYPGTGKKSLVRIVGDTTLCYKLMELFPDKESGVTWTMLDKGKTWAIKQKVRFRYEELYEPKTNQWKSPLKSIIQCIHGGDAHDETKPRQ